MTVKRLIERLTKMEPSLPVKFLDQEAGWLPVNDLRVMKQGDVSVEKEYDPKKFIGISWKP